MGTFYVTCELSSHLDRTRVARIPKMLVDTGSEYTWVAEDVLKKLKIAPEKKDVPFIMANGQTVTRQVGFAVVRVDGVFTTDEVVFAQAGDLQLLGARTLEGLNLRVDSRHKKLVAGGPLPAAGTRGFDLEIASLSANPTFLAIIERSRLRHEREGGVSPDEMRRRLGLTTKRRRATTGRRRKGRP